MAVNTTLEREERAKGSEPSSDVPSVTRDELKTMIGRGGTFLLIETLAPEQFEETHLPGAINLPPDRVRELAPSLLPDKQREVITYCASRTCHASVDAARELIALGYTHVRHYPGGKADWVFAGLPVERGSGLPGTASEEKA